MFPEIKNRSTTNIIILLREKCKSPTHEKKKKKTKGRWEKQNPTGRNYMKGDLLKGQG